MKIDDKKIEVLCIIPARGGSKRIKGKNLRKLGGMSLLENAILCAKGARLIDDIIVSTDDADIKAKALALSVTVHDRKPEHATDKAGLEEVVLDILSSYDPVDYVLLLQPTTPFIKSTELDGGIDKIVLTGSDSLLFCTKFERFVWTTDMKPLNYDYKKRERTQDMPTYLLENGCYITKPEIYRRYNNRLGGNMTYYIMGPAAQFEVDDEFDLAVCRGIYDTSFT